MHLILAYSTFASTSLRQKSSSSCLAYRDRNSESDCEMNSKLTPDDRKTRRKRTDIYSEGSYAAQRGICMRARMYACV